MSLFTDISRLRDRLSYDAVSVEEGTAADNTSVETTQISLLYRFLVQ